MASVDHMQRTLLHPTKRRPQLALNGSVFFVVLVWCHAAHIAENLSAADPSTALSPEDLKLLDAFEKAHPYYWSPKPNTKAAPKAA